MKKVLLIFLLIWVRYATAQVSVTDLRCEYLHNPLGIDVSSPRFSWELQSKGKNKRQSAYRILVSTDRDAQEKVWDSGKISGNETNQIHYQGSPLKPFTCYYWKVVVWDEQGKQSAWSDVARFSTGMFSAADWQAQWIGEGEPVEKYKERVRPSPLLRKEIHINKKVRQAFYFTSAWGIYEAYINGKKIGRQVFAPEWTSYEQRIQYQTHEVTHLLHSGANVLAATLGNGWQGRTWEGDHSICRYFIGQLVIRYDDGSTETVCTDSSWKYFEESPIRQATVFDGEEYDARNEVEGWNMSGFDDSQWAYVPAVFPLNRFPEKAENKYILCAQKNEPITVIKEIKPVSVHKVGANKYIFDMGQNMTGWCRLTLPYNPGRDIRLRYAEMLNDDRTLYTENLLAAEQTDLYHPADGKNATHHVSTIDYEPRFTYHGFRYVEVEGLTQEPSLNAILGKFVASSSPETGYIETSDKDVNKLWENIRRTQLCNLISVPTDCPQRSERWGWLGDAQTFSLTAIYNLDMAAFYTKWMRDIRDGTIPKGMVHAIAPERWSGIPGSSSPNTPGYADAATIVPYRLYLNYNDKAVLAEHYECMKGFIDTVRSHNPNFLWQRERGNMYGDWLNGDSIKAEGYPAKGGRVPDDVLATAFFANSANIVAKAARLLEKHDDAARYSALADSIRQAFTDKFVSPDGVIEGNMQAGYAIALEFDILPENLRAKAAAHMAEAVAAYDYRISTGILTTVFLMNQLSRYGYSDLAYRLFLSHRFPSWLYMIDNGATTVWERWDSYVAGRGFQNPAMNSFNHPALGQIGEWMYSHILGIRYDENSPGYRHFYIRPILCSQLTWAKGSYHSINGNIEVSWTNTGGVFTLDVNVPANTEATVVLPDGKTRKVGSGAHRF